MRLDRFLADSNLGTRKHVKKLIRSGAVSVDGKVVKTPETAVDLNKQKITIGSTVVDYHPEIFILLNKPIGYMCSTIDEEYPSVLNLIDPVFAKRAKIVGRLDADTTGVLLLTDNGKLNNRFINPGRKVEKVYDAELNHDFSDELLQQLSKEPVSIGKDEEANVEKAERISADICRVTVTEGKYHEIKRIFKHFGYEVVHLNRVRLGFLTCQGLENGKYRLLEEKEIDKLKQITGMDKESEE
jgi:16S rRNA pseudouridine516 synthase